MSKGQHKPEAVARRVAHALSVENPPFDDWCRFSRAVGAALFDINDRRDGIHGFDALWLAFGILDMHDEQLAKRQAEFSAADDAEREQVRQRRERLRELIRLVTIDGKPVTP